MKNNLTLIFWITKNYMDLRGRKVELKCSSFEDASKKFREYLVKKDLGASRCHEAFVLDGDKIVLRISYNGRLWTLDGELFLVS